MRDKQIATFLATWNGPTTGMLSYGKPNIPSSLSEVLETTGEHLRKYSLSPKAAEVILRRASKRGKKLPEKLEQALKAVSGGTGGQ